MSAFSSLEKSLDDLFVKQAPALPENAKKFIVQYLPYVTLFIGLLALYSAYLIWHWANYASSVVDYANRLSEAYGGPSVADERFTVTIWLSLVVLGIQIALYLMAFSPLRNRKKAGWDLLFYALLINVVYGVVVLFTDYGSVGNLLGTIIGSAIGLYFLFQIRASYSETRASAGAKSKSSSAAVKPKKS